MTLTGRTTLLTGTAHPPAAAAGSHLAASTRLLTSDTQYPDAVRRLLAQAAPHALITTLTAETAASELRGVHDRFLATAPRGAVLVLWCGPATRAPAEAELHRLAPTARATGTRLHAVLTPDTTGAAPDTTGAPGGGSGPEAAATPRALAQLTAFLLGDTAAALDGHLLTLATPAPAHEPATAPAPARTPAPAPSTPSTPKTARTTRTAGSAGSARTPRAPKSPWTTRRSSSSVWDSPSPEPAPPKSSGPC
ncbi:hypothetical protein DUI70_0118 [Streptomyces albus]|nr:hypothetical protein DUI70_0118 [Streptomyces albus]